MLTKRIIPCLDIKNGRTVKGVNFVDLRDAGDPVELAKQYADYGADELIFLDISAITGALPVPVPPPSPHVKNTMSEPINASLISCSLSRAASSPRSPAFARPSRSARASSCRRPRRPAAVESAESVGALRGP